MTLRKLDATIRERSALVLDTLPRDETFDWVDKVSIELTTMMLATLFDFPWEERRKLTYWSAVAITNIGRAGWLWREPCGGQISYARIIAKGSGCLTAPR